MCHAQVLDHALHAAAAVTYFVTLGAQFRWASSGLAGFRVVAVGLLDAQLVEPIAQ